MGYHRHAQTGRYSYIVLASHYTHKILVIPTRNTHAHIHTEMHIIIRVRAHTHTDTHRPDAIISFITRIKFIPTRNTHTNVYTNARAYTLTDRLDTTLHIVLAL